MGYAEFCDGRVSRDFDLDLDTLGMAQECGKGVNDLDGLSADDPRYRETGPFYDRLLECGYLSESDVSLLRSAEAPPGPHSVLRGQVINELTIVRRLMSSLDWG